MAIGSNVQDTPVPTTPSYATAADVAFVLGVEAPSAHGDEGVPTLAQWNQAILWAEADIDRTTKTSWRIRQAKLEYKDLDTFLTVDHWLALDLRHYPVKTLDAASGDALEFWNGGAWEDWLATQLEGRANQYWLQEDLGVLRLRRNPWFLYPDARVRVTYRYGYSACPADIQQAAALLAAARLGSNRTYAKGGHGSDVDQVTIAESIGQWRRDAYVILANYQHVGRGA